MRSLARSVAAAPASGGAAANLPPRSAPLSSAPPSLKEGEGRARSSKSPPEIAPATGRGARALIEHGREGGDATLIRFHLNYVNSD